MGANCISDLVSGEAMAKTIKTTPMAANESVSTTTAKQILFSLVRLGFPPTLSGRPVMRWDIEILAVEITDATSSGIAAISRVVEVHKSLVPAPQGCIPTDGL